MPLPTQAQQTFGTGGTALPSSGGALTKWQRKNWSKGRKAGARNKAAAGAQDKFNGRWGGQSTQGAIDSRSRGDPPPGVDAGTSSALGGAAGSAAGGGGGSVLGGASTQQGTSPKKPSMQPEQAAQTNAAVPGAFNPMMPETGIPKAEMGLLGGGSPSLTKWQRRNWSKGRKAGWRAKNAAPVPPQTPQTPAGGTPLPAPGGGVSGLPGQGLAGGEKQWGDRAPEDADKTLNRLQVGPDGRPLSKPGPEGSNALAGPGDDGQGARAFSAEAGSLPPDATQETMGPAPGDPTKTGTPLPASAEPQTNRFGGDQQFDAPIPKGFMQWTQKRRNNWKAAHAVGGAPAGQQTTDQQTQAGPNPDRRQGDGTLPPATEPGGEPAKEPYKSWHQANKEGASWEDFVANSDAPGTNFFAQREGATRPNGLKGNAPTIADYTAANGPVAVPSSAAQGDIVQSIKDPYLAAVAQQMQTWRTKLLALGAAGGGSPAANARLHKNISEGSQMLGAYGIDYNPEAGIASEGPGDVDNPDGDITPNERTDENTGLLDLADHVDFSGVGFGQLRQIFNSMGKDISKLTPAALLEFATNMGIYNDSLVNKQKGVNIMQPNVEGFSRENNPFRATSEDKMLEALQQGDPTDWEGVKNRYASDADKGVGQQYDALNSSAARRGLDPSAVSGFGAMLGAQGADTKARGLAELTNQQGIQGRNALYDALSMSSQVDSHYRGGESMARQQLANAVMGKPDVAANPASGFTNVASGMLGAQNDLDAARDAERDADRRREEQYWIQGGKMLLGGAGGGMGGGMPGFLSGLGG